MVPGGRFPDLMGFASDLLQKVQNNLSPIIDINVSDIMDEVTEELRSQETVTERSITKAVDHALSHQTQKIQNAAASLRSSTDSSIASSVDDIGSVGSVTESEEALLELELEQLKENHAQIDRYLTKVHTNAQLESFIASFSEQIPDQLAKIQKQASTLNDLETTLTILQSAAPKEIKEKIDDAITSLPTARQELQDVEKTLKYMQQMTEMSRKNMLVQQHELLDLYATQLQDQAQTLYSLINVVESSEKKEKILGELQKAINDVKIAQQEVEQVANVSKVQEQVDSLKETCDTLSQIMDRHISALEIEEKTPKENTSSLVTERQKALREAVKRDEEKTNKPETAQEKVDTGIEEMKRVLDDKARVAPKDRRPRTK